MLLLYELSIVVAALFERRLRRRAYAEAFEHGHL